MRRKNVLRTVFLTMASSLLALGLLTACEEEPDYYHELPAEIRDTSSVEEDESPASSESKETNGLSAEECQERGGLYFLQSNGTYVIYNICRGQINETGHTVRIEALYYDFAQVFPTENVQLFPFKGTSLDEYSTFTLNRIVQDNFYPTVSLPGQDTPWASDWIAWDGGSDDPVYIRCLTTQDSETLELDSIDNETARKTVSKLQKVKGYTNVYAFPESYKYQTVSLIYVRDNLLTQTESEIDTYLGVYDLETIELDAAQSADGCEFLDFSDVPEGMYLLQMQMYDGSGYATIVNVSHD